MQDYLNILAGGGSAIVVWILARILIANYKQNKEIKKQIKEKKQREEEKREKKIQKKNQKNKGRK